MTPRWDRRWYLPSTALAGLVFLLLRDRIDTVPLRGLVALGVVAMGGTLAIVVIGAIRACSILAADAPPHWHSPPRRPISAS